MNRRKVLLLLTAAAVLSAVSIRKVERAGTLCRRRREDPFGRKDNIRLLSESRCQAIRHPGLDLVKLVK